jgi:hypothetical protein
MFPVFVTFRYYDKAAADHKNLSINVNHIVGVVPYNPSSLTQIHCIDGLSKVVEMSYDDVMNAINTALKPREKGAYSL